MKSLSRRLRRTPVATPVLDARVLRRLGVELDDHTAARTVAQQFVAQLPARTRHLTEAVRGRDLRAALDATLSLKVTAAIVGGCRVEALAGEIETHLRDGSWGQARRVANSLRRQSPELRRSLGALLGC